MMSKEFYEKQKIDSIWPLSILASILVINWLLYFQFGETDMNVFYATVFSSSILCALLAIIRLTTVIDHQNIKYKFSPFHINWQVINWSDVDRFDIRTYKPFREYGGWGMRYGRSGKAYTIKGRTGLQIYLKNGKKLLIGTEKSDELSSFLKSRK